MDRVTTSRVEKAKVYFRRFPVCSKKAYYPKPVFQVQGSVVRVVVDFFINQGASKLFIDFCFVLLKSRTRVFFFVFARVCSYCAGVNVAQVHGRDAALLNFKVCTSPRSYTEASGPFFLF